MLVDTTWNIIDTKWNGATVTRPATDLSFGDAWDMWGGPWTAPRPRGGALSLNVGFSVPHLATAELPFWGLWPRFLVWGNLNQKAIIRRWVQSGLPDFTSGDWIFSRSSEFWCFQLQKPSALASPTWKAQPAAWQSVWARTSAEAKCAVLLWTYASHESSWIIMNSKLESVRIS